MSGRAGSGEGLLSRATQFVTDAADGMNQPLGKAIIDLAPQVMNAASILTAPAPSGPPSDYVRKVTKAAHEFEAVLLNTLLGPLEHTFSSLPGKENEVESDNYRSLGMQTLATSLAAKGGLGVADLIIKSLSRHAETGAAAHEKSLARGASLARPF